ncbi:MAG: bacteriohemerythrin [Thermodesulfobacteriota bacterium]
MNEMQRAVWDGSLAVNIDSVDEQHKRLVAMINEAQDFVRQDKPGTDLVYLIKKLFQYAEEHFATEEKYMADSAYPDAPAHKAEHVAFRRHAETFNLDLVLRTPHLANDILRYLWDWLRLHIAATDKKMGDFLASRGVR